MRVKLTTKEAQTGGSSAVERSSALISGEIAKFAESNSAASEIFFIGGGKKNQEICLISSYLNFFSEDQPIDVLEKAAEAYGGKSGKMERIKMTEKTDSFVLYCHC